VGEPLKRRVSRFPNVMDVPEDILDFMRRWRNKSTAYDYTRVEDCSDGFFTAFVLLQFSLRSHLRIRSGSLSPKRVTGNTRPVCQPSHRNGELILKRMVLDHTQFLVEREKVFNNQPVENLSARGVAASRICHAHSAQHEKPEIISRRPPMNTEEQARAKLNGLRLGMFFLGLLCTQVFTTFLLQSNVHILD
jgi:hypothetical protein